MSGFSAGTILNQFTTHKRKPGPMDHLLYTLRLAKVGNGGREDKCLVCTYILRDVVILKLRFSSLLSDYCGPKYLSCFLYLLSYIKYYFSISSLAIYS